MRYIEGRMQGGRGKRTSDRRPEERIPVLLTWTQSHWIHQWRDGVAGRPAGGTGIRVALPGSEPCWQAGNGRLALLASGEAPRPALLWSGLSHCRRLLASLRAKTAIAEVCC